MIDIHSHVLPGVDDGAPDLASARALCEMASREGTSEMIATPHQRHPSWANDDRGLLEEIWGNLKEEVSPWIKLHLGAEIRLDAGLLDQLDLGDQGHCLRLASSRYLLIELPRIDLGLPAEEILHEVVIAGYRPILAHPELIPYLITDPNRLERLVADGFLLQITAMSLTGEFGKGPQSSSRRMLRNGWVHFVASDTHSEGWRPPGLRAARQVLEDGFGEDVAKLLLETNPNRILQDQELDYVLVP